MPVFGVNMAVPIKDNNRESQIYFLSSTENVPPESGRKTKYVIFKTIQLILSISSLILFVCSVKASENKTEDMFICAALGALIIYPLLFISLSINVNQQSPYLIIINISAFIMLFATGGMIMSSWWTITEENSSKIEEKLFESGQPLTTMKITAAILLLINGLFSMTESLIMFTELSTIISPNRPS